MRCNVHSLPLLRQPPQMAYIFFLLLCAAASAAAFSIYAVFRRLRRPVYLIDYACYKPPPDLMVPFSLFMGHSTASGSFDSRSLDFQRKILQRSGLGEQTYLPPVMHRLPPIPTMAAARAEAEAVVFGAIDSLFTKTRLRPDQLNLLVVNCSLFNPTPSLSAMIIHRYKLPAEIRSFNLAGMGCSAGVVSVKLASDILQSCAAASYALVVSTENITQNWYFGNDRSMLIPNCLFRVGGAALLLTNRRRERRRAKYELAHVVRTHRGADDKAYGCVYQRQDDGGEMGVSLSKDLMAMAGAALKVNITTLGPLVLPISEQLHFFASLVARKAAAVMGAATTKILKPYIPNFKLAFEHFCVHAGGRAVIDELEKNLQLSPAHVEASRMTLHRFGNTSSSSIWYELAYTESKGRIKKGDRIWQIAFGSGFKCNSAVWVALRSLDAREVSDDENPWSDCIDDYPVEVAEIAHMDD